MLPSFHLPGMEPRPLRQCDIRTYVQNALIGFEARQAVRRAVRERKRKRNTQRAKVKRKGVPEMKSGIVFRTEFEQPIGPRNPANIRVPGAIPLEIFEGKVGEWRARRPGTRDEMEWIASQPSAETAKRQLVGIHFARQLTEWEVFDRDGKLQNDEWSTDGQGRVFVTELRRTRLVNKGIHERAERARQSSEDFGKEFERLWKG